VISGIHPETLRLSVRQDEADGGTRTDRLAPPSARSSPPCAVQVRDLRRSNEILKAASVFFARELDQPRPR
jgi:transposase